MENDFFYNYFSTSNNGFFGGCISEFENSYFIHKTRPQDNNKLEGDTPKKKLTFSRFLEQLAGHLIMHQSLNR